MFIPGRAHLLGGERRLGRLLQAQCQVASVPMRYLQTQMSESAQGTQVETRRHQILD